jgi:hypothetical protein
LKAVQQVLRKYQNQALPRDLSIFAGNITAARAGLRRLELQPDYNRIWPGGDDTSSAEHRMMAQIVETMRHMNVFASIDIHNNTGVNPHYACVNRIDRRFFHLATLFSRTVVYFTRPTGVQSAAFANLCPACTVECGKVGDRLGETHAADFIDACLHLDHLPEHKVARHDLDLFHTLATVKVPENMSFEFVEDGKDASADICFDERLDRLNFRELPAGTRLAIVKRLCRTPLHAWDEQGGQIADDYFELRDGSLHTRQPFIPAMFTCDARAIRQDCLGYIMGRMRVE